MALSLPAKIRKLRIDADAQIQRTVEILTDGVNGILAVLGAAFTFGAQVLTINQPVNAPLGLTTLSPNGQAGPINAGAINAGAITTTGVTSSGPVTGSNLVQQVGFYQFLPFGNMPASTTSGIVGTQYNNTGRIQIAMPYNVSIAAIQYYFVDATATAGTISFQATANGTTLPAGTPISNTTLSSTQFFARGQYPQSFGGAATVFSYTTNAAWSVPNSCKICLNIWVWM